MNQILRITSGFLLLLLMLTGCTNKDFTDFYKRPDNLAPAIYQQLQTKGNFKNLLACIDKAGYKEILSNAGYWTLFAPNDAAFAKYFTENSIKDVTAIDSVTARKIVTFSLVYNAYRQDQLTNYQSSVGVIPNLAFKKKSVYYDFVLTESGSTRKVIATNTNTGVYTNGDNNNKNVSFFTDVFLNAKGLSSADYTAFYPNATYTGFNVLDALVVNKDIAAENGIIQEIDRVILPQKSLDQYIASNSNYSEFKALLDKEVTYTSNADLSHRYNVLTGKPDSVYIKIYNNTLGFSPNNENYLSKGTQSQTEGYTIMAPTNAELVAYTKNILAYYHTFEAAPPSILADFLNAHMWAFQVWPSKIASSSNISGEVPTFSTSNIIDKKLLSNGVFYGTNKVQDANVFRTVYSKAYINPAFLLMLRGLDVELKYSIINPLNKYTMFMMTDVAVTAAGYKYEAARENNNTPWSFAAPGPPVGVRTYGAIPRDNFYKVLQTHVLQPNIDLTPAKILGTGIVETYNGQYIKYSNNTVWASGNVDAGNYLTVDSARTLINGTVYYTHEVVPTGKISTGGLLAYTTKTVGYHINQLALSDPTSFSYFNSYLINSTMWDAANVAILGTTTGTNYTVLIPTNAAIMDAVKAGYLPGIVATGVPTFNSTVGSDIDKVNNFIKYHILNKNTVVPDGLKDGAFATLNVNGNGDPTYVTVYYDPTIVDKAAAMQFRDMFNNIARPVLSKSNNLSDFTVIHSIDHFLKF